jgi:hypothetical protein
MRFHLIGVTALKLAAGRRNQPSASVTSSLVPGLCTE